MQPPRAPLAVFVAAFAAMALAAQAPAGPIIVTFEGHLTETQPPHIVAALGYDAPIVLGAPFSGAFSYDSDAAVDLYPEDVNYGRYVMGGEMWGTVGAVDFRASGLILTVHNDLSLDGLAPPDTFAATALNGHLGGSPLVVATFRIGGPASVLETDKLPDVLQLDNFPDLRYFSLAVPYPGDDAIALSRGIVTSVTLIPEPSMFVLAILLSFIAIRWSAIHDVPRPLLFVCNDDSLDRSVAGTGHHRRSIRKRPG